MNIASNGILIHVEEQGHGDLSLVFLHYWGGSSRTWHKVIAALPKSYRTIAIDHRGWGESDAPASGYGLADLADDAQGVIEALDLKRYILIGHSMGGKVAQLMASRRPEGLAGLVLVAPSPPQPMTIPPEARKEMAGAYLTRDSVGVAIDHMLIAKVLSPEDREQVIEDSLRGAPQAKAAWPGTTSLEDITHDVAAINAPTVVIAGELDRVDSVGLLKTELLSRIPHAALHVLPGTGHLSPLESSQELARLIRDFVNAQEVGGLTGQAAKRPAPPPERKFVEASMEQVQSTYRAVQAVRPGKLELTDKPLLDPPAGHVRIRVEACGVCHSDSATVEGALPIQWPRVPGHEAVGRIDVIGEGVEGWAVGQRVGVGFLGGSCGHCQYCRDGDLVNCANQGYTGVQRDGGYAEVMIAKSSGLIAVPDDLSSVDAAPLLCAGLTTFSALRNAPARAGDLVAVFGVGGLGHLGVQYARRMGFEVVAIDRGDDRAELSKKLGAHHYIDSSAIDIAEALQALGGAQIVLATASGGKAVAAAVGGLRRGGMVISLGATDEPIELSAFDLLFKQLGVDGALTGTPAAGDATLRFSALSDVAAMIEIMPLERAAEAYAKMMAGKARFRMVLTMT